VTSSIIPDISWRLSLWAASVGDAPYRAVSIPYGQKLKRPKERRRLSFGCYSLMQHDVRRECTRRRRPPARPPRNGPNDEKAETRARGLITKKPRIVVRGSPAFLTDRARGKWAAGCLPNAAGVSWFLSSKGCGRGRATAAAMRWRTPVTRALQVWLLPPRVEILFILLSHRRPSSFPSFLGPPFE
jgi:hypothetical protein